MNLAAILRSHPLTRGLSIVEDYANEHGTLRPLGVLNHHTASSPPRDAPSLSICKNGRPDLPGPLCNILGSRTGRIIVISNGIANHAGKGDPGVLARMRAGQPAGGTPGPDRSNAGGNVALIGIEWENNGTGEPWPPEQIDSMYRVNAALCDHFNWSPMSAVIGHLEWTRRKIDPKFVTPSMSMGTVRSNAAALLAHVPPPTPSKDWFDMATKEELKQIVDEVVEAKLISLVKTLTRSDIKKVGDSAKTNEIYDLRVAASDAARHHDPLK